MTWYTLRFIRIHPPSLPSSGTLWPKRNEGNANLMDERRCVVVQGTTRKRLRWIHSYTRDRNEWLLNVFYEMNISGIRNDISISSWERIEERLEIHDANRKGMIDLRDEGEEREEGEIRIKKCLIVDLLINAFSFFFFLRRVCGQWWIFSCVLNIYRILLRVLSNVIIRVTLL